MTKFDKKTNLIFFQLHLVKFDENLNLNDGQLVLSKSDKVVVIFFQLYDWMGRNENNNAISHLEAAAELG